MVRNKEGYTYKLKGGSPKRTVLLIVAPSDLIACGFVWITSSGMIPWNAERSLDVLKTLLKNPPTKIGFSPEVKSLRFQAGVYQRLMWEVVNNIVTQKETRGKHFEDALSFFLKLNPVIPTEINLLNLLDPGWIEYKGYLIRKDVLTSRFAWQLIGQRKAKLDRGAVIFTRHNFPTPLHLYFIRTYMHYMCRRLAPIVSHVYENRHRRVFYTMAENDILAIIELHTSSRKRNASDMNYSGALTIESMPQCLHDAINTDMDNIVRWNFATIITQVSLARGDVNPTRMRDMLVREIVRVGRNNSRIKDIKTRIDAEMKTPEKATSSQLICRFRHNTGITCPFDNPSICLNSREGGDMIDPMRATITDVWLHSDPHME